MIFRFSSFLFLKLLCFSGLSQLNNHLIGEIPEADRGSGCFSSIEPTTEAARYGLNRLLDGKLQGWWRSTWTAWYQKDPVITFDLGSVKKLGNSGIFQAGREDELKSIDVEVSIDGENFTAVSSLWSDRNSSGKGHLWKWICGQ